MAFSLSGRLGIFQSQNAMPKLRRVFNTKEEAVMFFTEKNVRDKKPQRVTRSSKDRFSAACKVDWCQYKVSVRKQFDPGSTMRHSTST